MTLKRLCYLLVVLVAVWSGYYLLQKHWQSDDQVTIDSEKPVFTGDVVSNTSYNEKGIRSYQIDSAHIEHFSISGNTTFSKPVLWVYQDGSKTEWRVSANNALLTQDQVLEMKGNVRIFNLLPESAIQVISTDNLRLNLVNKDFDTQDHVVITGTSFENEGDGLKGNMDRNVATLLNNVKGIYETPKD
ncbi:TPA: LPS export ABC transporter periplasmic protein LptC [Photobacterium damselae]